MRAQVLDGLAGDHLAQVRTGCEVVGRRELQLLADVHTQLLHGLLDLGQGLLEGAHVGRRLVLDERQEERLLVGEVVVDRRAADARTGGDVRERDGVEAALAHERGERLEKCGARALAVLRQ
nr:hypothetical protein DA06_09300 [Georgenia sp. SUBG003]